MFGIDNRSIGNTIRRLRKSKGLSQEVLNSFADIARSHLSMIENGSKQANFETICKIAAALDMRPYELVKVIEEDIIASQSTNQQNKDDTE